ncbi:hypothetical protein JIG36_22570 [Actinoplanes sp. LDG1-06]|uniref:histidine kinase n=1 Tax=Paractinoplanes ovalisporus TaxID=2810368 RepID=A0ABS2AGH8_9ACTN|nr:histidine kinase [Actinoplanes ovalisporus]MBM2618349.1 hypothetical protein [Actinoplanes ovalisporus]
MFAAARRAYPAGIDGQKVPSRTLRVALASAAVAAAAMSLALARAADRLPQATLFVWILLAYVFCGLLAWTRRPGSAFGRLMVLVGFGAALSTLAWSSDPVLFTVGQALDLLVVVLFLHVFLAFPAGRLNGTARVLVLIAYGTSVGLQLTAMTLGAFGPGNLLRIVDAPTAATVVHAVELVTLSALLLAGVGLLAVRRKADNLPLRRSVRWLVDAFALGLVSLAVLLVMGVLSVPGFALVQAVTLGVLGLAPVAFLVGLLDARLARAALGELMVELRTAPGDLSPALARVLRDPTARLLYWLPQYRSWVDHDGAPAELPASATLIRRGGEPVAAIAHHPAVAAERDLLDAVVAAVEMVLDNGRLRAELKAGLAEVRGSRARVVEAGRRERRRLERDLHDGAQQRLVGLSLRLSLIEARLGGDPAAREAVAEARVEVATSLTELRDIARGLYPGVLSAHGLAVAVESVPAPVPLRLDVRLDGRLPEAVEVAAYYVVCESLTNVGRHAGASSAGVCLHSDGDRLVVEIEDDGVGGADTRLGSGLRGLADRVEALGGTLRVWSPAGGGTRVRAELPCG